MEEEKVFKDILIRDSSILARIPLNSSQEYELSHAEFFDVRTGSRLKEIHPPMNSEDIKRGYSIETVLAGAIVESGCPVWMGYDTDPGKVTSILEIRQRKLDSVVADSILDQVRVIHGLLSKFVQAASMAKPEQKYWLSQQLLTFVRKFSGRELAELDEIADWLLKNIKK